MLLKVKKGENRKLTTGFSIMEVTGDLNRKGFHDMVEVEASIDSYGNERSL